MTRTKGVRIRLSLSPEEVDTLWVVCIAQRGALEKALANVKLPDDELAAAARERQKLDAILRKIEALPRHNPEDFEENT